MGQQQLILLVLATVIVGLAIVVGIQAFTENSARANADAMMQDAVRIANDIQAAIEKPGPFGGVDGFDAVNFGVLGYPNDAADGDGTYTNTNGDFILTQADDNVLITGTFTRDGVLQNQVEVQVCGFTSRHIAGRTVTIGEQGTGAGDLVCPTPDPNADGGTTTG